MKKSKLRTRLRRERMAREQANAEAKRIDQYKEEQRRRRKFLEETKEDRTKRFWGDRYQKLDEITRVGINDTSFVATPCTKKRSVLDDY